MFKLFLLLTLIATVVYATTCPNDCSGQGTCNTASGVCSCRNDRTGADCSIYQHIMERDTWVEGNVEIWSWRFYQFNTGFGAGGVRWEVESLDDDGDCDLYVRFGERPDRLNWDAKDTDVSADAVVDVLDSQAGTWYAGVFGFYPCHYRIRVQFLGSCAVPCGEHGTCRSGECICDRGWSGPGCTETQSTMVIGQLYTGTVEEKEWKFFKMTLSQAYSAVLVTLNQTGGTDEEDCDLYARFGNPPTEYDWDYFDQNWRETYSAVNIADPEQGDWFVGVFGYARCSFKIRAEVSSGCPNRCSRRGSCTNGRCHCQLGYDGTYCENTQDGILLGQRLQGYVEYLTWNFFHIATESQAALLVTVEQDSASADCDIYVRRGERPTTTEYDYYDVSYGQVTSVTIPSPGVATWHIGVIGASYNTPCQYSISTSTTGDCSVCEHGSCLAFGYCDCEDGWAGEGCNVAVIPLTSGQSVSGTITPRTWKYYTLTSTSSTITVSLRERNTIGYIWLFQSLEISPTLRYYDDQDIDTDSAFHTITVDATWWADENYPYTYYFGVYGSPLAARDIEFDIVAWDTPF